MFQEMLAYVIDIIAGIFAGFLLLRFWMQALRLRAPAPIGQSIFQLTDWFIKPLRRIIPGYAGYDWASLIAAYLVAIFLISIGMLFAQQFSLKLVLVFSLIQLFQWIIYGLMALLVLEVIFSFVNPHAPLAPLVNALNQPLLAPLRKLIPPMGGFDFSVLLAFIVLQLFSRMLMSVTPYLIF
jgi:YggT family protein